MSNEYQSVDGSPRYGVRHDPSMPALQEAPARPEDFAESAAKLGLDHMAAAIDLRLTSAWADAEDPLMAALHEAHPEDLSAARALVRIHLGSQRQWRLKAQAVRDEYLAATVSRRRAAGSTTDILLLRLGLLMALLIPPMFVVASGKEDLVKLVLAGAACIAGAFIGGHFLTIRSRVPVMPDIRGAWLNELRDDIVNATLVVILQNKGLTLDARTVTAGRRGWDSIRTAELAVDSLQR